MKRQRNDPLLSEFLEPGAEYFNYYKWKVFALLEPEVYKEEQIFTDGARYVPPQEYIKTKKLYSFFNIFRTSSGIGGIGGKNTQPSSATLDPLSYNKFLTLLQSFTLTR